MLHNGHNFWTTKDGRIVSIRDNRKDLHNGELLAVDLYDMRTMGVTEEFLVEPIKREDLHNYKISKPGERESYIHDPEAYEKYHRENMV